MSLCGSPPLDPLAAVTDKSDIMGNSGDATEAGLRASRARLLAAADDERRQIERALHDGVQQDLVALAVQLQLVRKLADSEPAAARALLDEIAAEVHDALDRVRELSERIYPSVLAARGLAEALRGMSAAKAIPIGVQSELNRYQPHVEGAVYVCCREALTSAAARGARPTLRIWEEDETLRFEIGVDRESELAESEICYVRDCVDVLGGSLMTVADPTGKVHLFANIPLS